MSHSHDPDWLEEANDEKHRQESLPLLGGGDVLLQDEPPAAEDDALATNNNNTTDQPDTYGAVVTTIQVPAGSGNKKEEEQGTVLDKIGQPASAGTTNNAGNTTTETVTILLPKPHVPSQNPLLWLFHLLQGVTALTALLLLISQLLPLLAPHNKPRNFDLLNALLKVYVSLCCVAILIVEAELPLPAVRDSALLANFASRGFMYSFVGLVCTTEAYSERVDDAMTHATALGVGWTAVFLQVVAWILFAVGMLYIVMGILCLRRVRNRLKQHEKEAWQKYRADMKVWKKAQQESRGAV